MTPVLLMIICAFVFICCLFIEATDANGNKDILPIVAVIGILSIVVFCISGVYGAIALFF